MVQHLASMCGKNLIVINMHVTSDPADLIGGFKPLDIAAEVHSSRFLSPSQSNNP